MPKGLKKAKNYDWKDTNIALIGSDADKQAKKEVAQAEPAWQSVGQDVGLKIWRIVDFQVTEWPEKDYGKFYNGDSYIILNTYKDEESEALRFDAHFWIGKNSTQDEYGTVAFKTVELDAFLDDAAVQHREVQGHESQLFASYFPNGLSTMEGGADSGFNHVEPETYTPRLLHFNGKKPNRIAVREVNNPTKDKLKMADVYILDQGVTFIQLNREGASPFEKMKAVEYMVRLRDDRNAPDGDMVIDEGSSNDAPFYEGLATLEALNEGEDDGDESDDEDEEGEKKLFRLNTSENSFEHVKSGDVTKDDFNDADVFLLDTPGEVFVFIGATANSLEKLNGLPRAHSYMKTREGKPSAPLTVLKEGLKSTAFNVAISA